MGFCETIGPRYHGTIMTVAITRCSSVVCHKLGATHSGWNTDRYQKMLEEHFAQRIPFKPHFALVDEVGQIWLWSTEAKLLKELQAKQGKAS